MSSRRRTTKAKSSQLGDLTFDDWYETPVFDTEPDERLEQLATSRRAPVRLIGSAMLRLAPDRPSLTESARGTDPAAGTDPADDNDPAADADFAAFADAPARPGPPAGSWRERAGRLIDRWAAMEAASGERLEELVLPKRWRG